MDFNQIPDKNIHDGHRGRMRAKLAMHGADIFDTYELLEMLLYSVIPFKDTNPVAKRLLAAFGNLEGIFSADRDELMQVVGVGERVADYLIEVGRLPELLKCESVKKTVNYSDYIVAGRHFVDYFKGLSGYKVTMLLFDNKMLPITHVDLYDIDFKSAAIRPGSFIGAALKSRASVAILAHNHPFGPMVPSESDRVNNDMVATALSDVGVLLLEHYVISGNRYIGFMSRYESSIAQSPNVKIFLESKRRAELLGLLEEDEDV